MTGPMNSDGGRQHASGTRRRLRLFSPMAAAMAAGVVYGVAVWEPLRTQDKDDARSASMLRQPDRVTEDAAGLHLYSPREPNDETGTDDPSARVGWLRTGGREEGMLDRAGLPRESLNSRTTAVTRADQNEGADEVPTSSLHSRGPPR